MANNLLLASDNFASGSLAAGWVVVPNGTGFTSQISSAPHYAEAHAVGSFGGQIWTGLSFPNDQIGEVTVQSLVDRDTTTNIQLFARINGAGTAGYVGRIYGNGTNYLARIEDYNLGTTLVGPVTLSSLSSGDVFTLAAIGSVVLLYQNGTRLCYVGSAAYTGGSPGFGQNVTTGHTITDCQVASWRGYSVTQQDGVWTKKGCILPPNSTELGATVSGVPGLTVLYGPSQFLNPGHNCYRGYTQTISGSTSSVIYAESLDGISWTRYSSNPLIASYAGAVPTLFGGTLYMWNKPSPGGGAPHMFTSTDGITWTDGGTTSGLSVSGYFTYSPYAVWKIGGVFKALLPGLKSDGTLAPASFLFTSSDGLTWTVQNSGNAVVNSFAGCSANQVGSTYYFVGTSNQPGQSGVNDFDPVAAVLYQSTDLIHWTQNSVMIQNALYCDSLNNFNGGIAPNTLIDVNGTASLYYQGSPADASSPQDYQPMLAQGPTGVSWTRIVTQSESGTVQVASDNFSYGPGNLNGNWTTPTGVTKLQIVSGPYVEANALTTNCAMLYTGAVFGTSQYSEMTIKTLTGSAALKQYFVPIVYGQTGSLSGYALQLAQTTGMISAGGAEFSIVKMVSGAFTTIGSGPVAVTPQVGDVFRLSVSPGSDGSNILTAFQNGFQVLQVQDYAATYTSGSPGMYLYATDALADLQVSLWAGGTVGVIPSYAAGGAASLLLLGVG